MNAVESINHFVDVMLNSQTKFSDIKNEADRRNNAVKECISRFESGIRAVMSKPLNIKDSELQEIVHRQISELDILLKKVAASIEATRKGMQFIKEYEDSFNVAVFGKVKAGKSYTGNFIMGNVIRELGIHTSYDRPECPDTITVIDKGRKSTRDKLAEIKDKTGARGFAVGVNETTSTIQIFRLGGMVWVDTPGIGSVTLENEELAKNFVDNVDLIVYMSHSDFAGTKQDFDEMRALHNRKKRFLLLLTQSDTTALDYENGRVVKKLAPKSEADRSSMEDYVCETLTANGIKMDRGSEVLTISTKLALEGLKRNDEAMFDASSMKKFFEVLESITQNDAAKLKLATPSGRIDTMIDEITSALQEADSKLTEHMKSLEDTRTKLSERNDYLQSKMLNECMSAITETVTQKAREVESGGAGITGEDLQRIVSSKIYETIMKTCAEEFSGSEAILSGYSDSLKVGNVSGLEMRRDTITYKCQVSESYERDPDGLFEHIGAFFGKTYYGTRTRTIEEHRSVDLGSNLQQVLPEIRERIDSIFREKVPGIMKRIADEFIAPVAQVREDSGREIHSAVSALTNLKCSH